MIESINLGGDLGPGQPLRTAPRQLTIVSDDVEFGSVMRDALREWHEVVQVGPATPMTVIADTRPAILVLGPITPQQTGSSLSVWDLVALARAHRELRRTPIILLTSELDAVMADTKQLVEFAGVHAVGIPLDLDTLRSVLRSIERGAQDQATNRVPDVCIHGYEFGLDGPAECTICTWSVAQPDR